MSSASPHLQIHVIGGPIGESMIVGLPCGQWGVIDCYSTDTSDSTQNPTVSHLRSLGVTDLKFVALTHPHDDHLRGMKQLFDAFSVAEFWQFPAVPHPVLRQLLNYERLDSEMSLSDDRRKGADELVKLFAKVEGLTRSGSLVRQYMNLGLELYTKDTMRITSVAPSGGRTSEYVRRLSECFNADGTFKQHLEIKTHNMISAALLFEYGDTRIMLGGDVEERGWEETLERYKGRLASHAVKVSHHGSSTGYCKNLWEEFSAGGKPIAVITPFRRFNLPEQKVLDYISLHARNIVLTFKEPPLSRAAPLVASAPPRSRECIAATFGATAARNVTSPGIYSMSFDDNGYCFDETILPPAARHSP